MTKSAVALGENITKQRQITGISRKELAKQLEVSEMALSSYERGMREPSLDKIKQLAEIFNCTLIDLIADNPSGAKADIIFEYRLQKAKEVLNLIGYKLVDPDTAKIYHRRAGYDDESFEQFNNKENFFIVSADDDNSNPLIMENAKHFVSTIERMKDLAAEPLIRKIFSSIFTNSRKI